MTRYFFDFNDGTGLASDEVGMEFGSVDEARLEAAETLSEICKDVARSAGNHNTLSVTVRDEDGRTRFTASMVFELR